MPIPNQMYQPYNQQTMYGQYNSYYPYQYQQPRYDLQQNQPLFNQQQRGRLEIEPVPYFKEVSNGRICCSRNAGSCGK